MEKLTECSKTSLFPEVSVELIVTSLSYNCYSLTKLIVKLICLKTHLPGYSISVIFPDTLLLSQ